MVIEAYRASEATNPWTATPAEVLLRSPPAMAKHLTENACDMTEPHWTYYTRLMFAFVHRVLQLEAEGKNPVMRVSW